ncbi:zinc-ribbon domain containing protein [Chloroflexota bacterium]
MTRTLAKIVKRGGHLRSFQDKLIRCSDCGATFTFSAGEQEFFQSKGLTNETRRCTSRRRSKKEQYSTTGYHSYGSR